MSFWSALDKGRVSCVCVGEAGFVNIIFDFGDVIASGPAQIARLTALLQFNKSLL
jgi:hypothetical protein